MERMGNKFVEAITSFLQERGQGLAAEPLQRFRNSQIFLLIFSQDKKKNTGDKAYTGFFAAIIDCGHCNFARASDSPLFCQTLYLALDWNLT